MSDERAPTSTEPEPRSLRVPIALLSLAALGTAAYLIWREARADHPYRVHQLAYAELLGRRVPVGIRPLVAGGGAIVDRCPTCHLAVGEPPAKKLWGVRQPLRPHPGTLLASHPPERFGCTSCHGAGGDLLDRCLPARPGPEGRALGARAALASCPRCHAHLGGEGLAGGARLDLGIRAYRRLGCGGCHRAERAWDDGRRIGPPLDGVAAKLDRGTLHDFLADPQRERPGSAMPSFFSADALRGAPALSRARLARDRERELDELVAFLANLPTPSSLAPATRPAAPSAAERIEAGRVLFARLACGACHGSAEGGAEATRLVRAGLGGVGPDLSRAGARLAPAWIERWLAGPRRLHPATRMPDLRLADAERGALAAFLGSRGRPTSSALRVASPARGRAHAERLGCAGCHLSSALEGAPPAGPELDGFGEKRLELLDWGSARVPPGERTARRWAELKLTTPLAFDRPPGVLAMPWQHLRAGELEGLLLVLRSLGAPAPAGLAARPAERARRLREGERLLEELACRRCHSVGGRGGAIAALHPRPSDRPPALEGEGAKVQPAWLHAYLRAPTPLRPWLGLRMPTPAISDAEAESLVAYLAAQDRASFPFHHQAAPRLEGAELAAALQLFTRFQCLRCHLLSNAPRLKPGELSPDLALSGARLRRTWIQRFILEPQAVMPGTRMPTLFPLADEDDPRSRITPVPSLLGGSVQRQIDALTELNLFWGSAPASVTSGAAPAPR